MSKLLALAVFAGACTTATADVAPSSVTPYSCDGLEIADQTPSTDPAVVTPWHALNRSARRDEAWVDAVRALAIRGTPSQLTTETKVRIQHELVALAQALASLPRTTRHADTQARVMSLAARIAPTAAELELLGDGNLPEVHAVLGPALGVVERATRTCGDGNSIHVARHGGLLAFRPLRSATTRALVSQLVAFDTDGAPHVTPLVEGMELRLGDAVDAPACIVQARLDGTLAIERRDSFEEHAPFVYRRGDGVGCRNCHYDANTMDARDLTASEVVEVDAARTRQIERLATRTWNRLAAPLQAHLP